MSSIIRNKYFWIAISAVLLLDGCGRGTTTPYVAPTPAPTYNVIPITMPYNGSVGTSGSASYYSYVTTATTSVINMTNLTADADPKVYTSAAFSTLDTNWSCTVNVGTTPDTCTATTPIPAGTTMYIKALSYSSTGAAYTLSANNTTGQGSPYAPLAISLPYYGGSIAASGYSYYMYTATASRSLITVTNITNDVDPVIFTSSSFLTIDTTWTCTANAGTTNDTCSRTVAVPAGTVLYIRIFNWGGLGGTYSIL